MGEARKGLVAQGHLEQQIHGQLVQGTSKSY